MAELPSGTVTFLLTDVEGSTALWEEAPEAMRVALARHDALFDDAIKERGGSHIRPRGEGDSRFAVFSSAPNAVAAAVAIQRAFADEPWPTPRPITVRIGIHTGEADLRDGDYYGSAINRCARLRGIGHGGQVLLSEVTTILVREAMPSDVRLLDLGRHRLKDLTEPERVSQVVASDLPADFPPLASLDARPHNLPTHPTALLGRERELAEVRKLFGDGARLVTLTGPGGTGKTRLGLQVAADLLDDFGHGVFLVDLAPISDPALVPSTIAQALVVRDVGSRPVLDTVKEYLRARSILLLLDNFEHILSAASVVVDLLASCPDLAVLATSREPLRLRGEHEYPVPPLALPDATRAAADGISHYAAVALFLERARTIRSDFLITDENAASVAEICARLDGLPLPIELAAARIRLLSPQAMLNRLDRRLPLLAGGPRDLPARQQTLRAAIAWSYDLLNEQERTLFRRMSIFVGGCTLDAIERVANSELPGASEESGRAPLATHGPLLDAVATLAAKSLLQLEPGLDGEPRYRMLATIREFGQDQLESSGEVAPIRDRHAAFFLELAEQAGPKLYGGEQVAWLRRIVADYANLRTVLGWSRQRLIAADVGLQIVGALSHFWILQGFVQEGRDSTDALLTLPDTVRRTATRAGARYAQAMLAEWQTDFEVMRSSARESAAIYRETGDLQGTGRALSLWAIGERVLGSAAEGRALLEQGATIAREIDDRWGLAYALGQLGPSAQRAGDLDAARALRAESATLAREVGERHVLGLAVAGLAALDLVEGNLGSATTRFKEALTVSMEIEDALILPRSLAGLASIASRQADHQRATRLLARAQAQRDATGTREVRSWREIFDSDIVDVRAALGAEAFAAAWAEGRAMTLEQVVAYALDEQP